MFSVYTIDSKFLILSQGNILSLHNFGVKEIKKKQG